MLVRPDIESLYHIRCLFQFIHFLQAQVHQLTQVKLLMINPHFSIWSAISGAYWRSKICSILCTKWDSIHSYKCCDKHFSLPEADLSTLIGYNLKPINWSKWSPKQQTLNFPICSTISGAFRWSKLSSDLSTNW